MKWNEATAGFLRFRDSLIRAAILSLVGAAVIVISLMWLGHGIWMKLRNLFPINQGQDFSGFYPLSSSEDMSEKENSKND